MFIATAGSSLKSISTYRSLKLASGTSLANSGNTIGSKLAKLFGFGNLRNDLPGLICAIKAGEVDEITVVQQTNQHVPYYEVYAKRRDGQSFGSPIKLLLAEDVRGLETLCSSKRIKCYFDTTSDLVSGGKSFGKEAMVQLVAPIALTFFSIYGLKQFSLFNFARAAKSGILSANQLENRLKATGDLVPLSGFGNHIVGVPKIESIAQNAHRYIEDFARNKNYNTDPNRPFGAVIYGTAGSGKSVLIQNIVHRILTKDSQAIAFELGSAKNLLIDLLAGAEDKAKQLIKMSVAKGKRRILLYVDDPEKEIGGVNRTLELMKALKDHGTRAGIEINCFMTTNASLRETAGMSIDQIEAYSRRLGGLHLVDNRGMDHAKQIAVFLAREYGETDVPNELASFLIERTQLLGPLNKKATIAQLRRFAESYGIKSLSALNRAFRDVNSPIRREATLIAESLSPYEKI